MEIIQYTEEHRIFREALRKFFEKEVIPHADEWEEAGRVPKSVWRKMGEQGFSAWMCPRHTAGSEPIFSIR
jgi:acyl-CoA dehydrogenase